MRKIYHVVEQAAPTSASVLITGESGTGKELIAQTIHQLSPRASFPVRRDQLRRHSRNAARERDLRPREGRLHRRRRSSPGLLRARRSRHAVSRRNRRDDADDAGQAAARAAGAAASAGWAAATSSRSTCASSRRPTSIRIEAVQKGKLREDLFYRLNVFAICLPPLRDRRDDLPLLVQAFLHEFNLRNQKSIAGVDQQAMRMLEQYSWPGNVRELRNVIERATILAPGPFIEPRHLPPTLSERAAGAAPAAGGAGARDHGRGSRAPADHDDARPHARQQDPCGRNSRHQPEDAAQQAQQAAAASEEGRASSRPAPGNPGTELCV